MGPVPRPCLSAESHYNLEPVRSQELAPTHLVLKIVHLSVQPRMNSSIRSPSRSTPQWWGKVHSRSLQTSGDFVQGQTGDVTA